MSRPQIENRYNPADWEIDPDSWLWRPSTKLALLGDGYGTTKARSSGPGVVTGTLTDTTWSRDSYLGRCANTFNGSTSVISTAFPFVPAPFTLSVWGKPTAITTGYATLLARGGVFTNNTNFALGVRASGGNRLFCFWKNGATLYGAETVSALIQTGKWHHFAATVDASYNLVTYLNGVVLGTDGSNGAPADGGQNLTYGSFTGDTAKPWTGSGSDPLIFNFVLTAPQIRQLASRRPDMGGLIRSRHQVYYPTATTETPPAVTYWTWARQHATQVIGAGV